MFKCDCCGLCCMNLNKSDLYDDLNRGDGVCKYFDEVSKLCSIYERRPSKCNIDKMYDILYKSEMSKKEYYELNYNICDLLKKGERK